MEAKTVSILLASVAALVFTIGPRVWAQAPAATASAPEGKQQTGTTKPAASVAGAGKSDLKILQSLDQKYLQATSITMDLQKTVKLGLLGKERQSKGKVVLAKGKMRMELESPDKSLVVFDKKVLWVVVYPSPDLKDAPLQVAKSVVGEKKGKSEGLIALLGQGGLLKHFKVSGVMKAADAITYFLQPNKATSEFKRAQVVITPEGGQIRELKYWDELDNETEYKFSGIAFNKKVPANTFEFTPPKGAEVTVY